MAQLSIFDKQRHRSDKDMTVSIGKGDTVYITFRHDSWKRFTQGDKIAVSVTNDTLSFGDPDRDRGVAFKLSSNKAGNPETKEHTRYIQICGKAWPALLEAARKMAGSYNFDEAPKLRAPTPEEIEKLKKAIDNAPLTIRPLEEEEVEEIPELIAPKGFIILHASDDPHFAYMMRVDWITGANADYLNKTSVQLIHENLSIDFLAEEPFEKVVAMIRKALEV